MSGSVPGLGYPSLGAPTYMLNENNGLNGLSGLPSSSLPILGSLGQSNHGINSQAVSTATSINSSYSQFSNRFNFQNDQYSSVSRFNLRVIFYKIQPVDIFR